MNLVIDFLTFRTMISEQVLIVFYYLGAAGMPLAAWLSAAYLMRRCNPGRDAYALSKHLFVMSVPKRRRVQAIALFAAAFMFMELMWRLMFEYLIAFMQIREALVG